MRIYNPHSVHSHSDRRLLHKNCHVLGQTPGPSPVSRGQRVESGWEGDLGFPPVLLSLAASSSEDLADLAAVNFKSGHAGIGEAKGSSVKGPESPSRGTS